MLELTIFNLVLLTIIGVSLFLCKKYIKTEKTKNLIFIISPIVTIVFHYSMLAVLLVTDGSISMYLRCNPNLLLPIYPCNVVMWGCLIYGIIKNKESKVAKFLADYLFWFGIVSTLVGMFANVDFIRNPTLKDYDILKGIIAHATLLFNVLLLYIFGRIKVDLIKNMIHITIAVIMMYVIGMYCNVVFRVIASYEMAYEVNSMFIIHSPFPVIEWLRYPIIAVIALVLYFILFFVWEFFAYPKGNRWFNRLFNRAI